MSIETPSETPRLHLFHARDAFLDDQAEPEQQNLDLHSLFGGIAIHAYRTGDVGRAYEATLLDEFLCEKPPTHKQ